MNKYKNTEFFTQPHQMWAEGMCDEKPVKEEILDYLNSKNYGGCNIDIWLDTFQNVWRWNADLTSYK